MQRNLFTAEHDTFRQTVRRFVAKEITPYNEQWEKERLIPRELWRKAGEIGLLGINIPAEYGGAGAHDFRYSVIIMEEVQRSGAGSVALSFSLHSDIVAPYLVAYGSEAQKQRWLPGVASGEHILAVAMTEPNTGSDLAAIRTTALRQVDHYVLNGQKTVISNGIQSDLIVVAAKTDPSQTHKGLSLLVVEGAMGGFRRGRKLDKIGLHAQDTAELFFDNVRVPLDNRLGEEGRGFIYLTSQLPQERLVVAVTAVAGAEAALEWTVQYCKERTAFGQPIGSFQNTRFKLAEMQTEVQIARVFVDRCVEELNHGTLTPDRAAMAKWWCSELQCRVIDQCLQLFGGYGYMMEYPIARAYIDARVQRIYAGTNEIMKEIIGRAMGV